MKSKKLKAAIVLMISAGIADVQSQNGKGVYVATNHTTANTVVGFIQDGNGALNMIGEFPTEGKGTGNVEIFDWGYDHTHPLKDGIDPLISAYGLTNTKDGKFVIVVNAGDASISTMKVMADKSLTSVDKAAAGDIHPLSVASHGNLVYVASSGNVPTPPFSGNLKGFKIDANGKLTAISNSVRDLNARPSCVAFTEDGKFLVVNELVSGLVKIYAVNTDGSLSDAPVSQANSPHDSKNGRWLPIPVGFDIVKKGNKHIVLVSEARFLDNKGMLREETNKVPQSPKYSWQTGSTSSYVVDSKGQIELVSGDVKTGNSMEGGQIANCWVEISKDGKTLWAANALSSSISSYSIADNGELKLTDETLYKDTSEELFFSDLVVSEDGKYLYQLIGNQGAVMVFEVLAGNKLKELGVYSSTQLPKVGTYGIITL
ncbi:lactonase family protein [Joostella sp.]|uniref:lactonase family protein n=1 Tax=Joostella sp. TaxID=2231138 RepID=UPI003A9221C3